MKTLPKGSTGFWDVRSAPPPIVSTPQKIKSATWQIAIKFGWSVREFIWADGFCTFHFAEICKSNRNIFILHHKYLRINSITLTKSQYIEECQFASFKSIFHTDFCDFTTNFIDPEFLNAPPTPERLVDLSKAELSMVKYHKPSRLGEILFNSWT